MLQERAFPIIHELIKDAVSRVRIPSSPPAMIGRGEHRVGKQRVDEMAPSAELIGADSYSIMKKPGTNWFKSCCLQMSNTEQKASNGMIKFVLTIFVIAMIVAVAYLMFFTTGQSVQ
jgi:hypothetical protein